MTTEPVVASIEARLVRLEASNRRLKLALGGMSAAVCAVVLIAAGRQESRAVAGEVRARRLVIVDSKGLERATLAVGDETEPNGTRAPAVFVESAAELRLFDSAGVAEATMRVGHRDASIALRGRPTKKDAREGPEARLAIQTDVDMSYFPRPVEVAPTCLLSLRGRRVRGDCEESDGIEARIGKDGTARFDVGGNLRGHMARLESGEYGDHIRLGQIEDWRKFSDDKDAPSSGSPIHLSVIGQQPTLSVHELGSCGAVIGTRPPRDAQDRRPMAMTFYDPGGQVLDWLPR